MCAAGSQRLSSKTAGEREARLKNLGHNQSQRLSSEISGI